MVPENEAEGQSHALFSYTYRGVTFCGVCR